MPAKPSALLDTRVIYCGDNLDQLRKLPEACVEREFMLESAESLTLGYASGTKMARTI